MLRGDGCCACVPLCALPVSDQPCLWFAPPSLLLSGGLLVHAPVLHCVPVSPGSVLKRLSVPRALTPQKLRVNALPRVGDSGMSGLCEYRAAPFSVFQPTSFPLWALPASLPRGEPLTVRLQSPVSWSLRHACLRGCDASPRARIHLLACSA